MSNVNGSPNTSSSAIGRRSIATTRIRPSALTTVPSPRRKKPRALRVHNATGRRTSRQHLFDRAGAYDSVGAVAIDLTGFAHERLQSRGERVPSWCRWPAKAQHEERRSSSSLAGRDSCFARSSSVITAELSVLPYVHPPDCAASPRVSSSRYREEFCRTAERFPARPPRPREFRLHDAVERFFRRSCGTIPLRYADEGRR